MSISFDCERQAVTIEVLDGIASVVERLPAAGKPEWMNQLRDCVTQVFVFWVKYNAYHGLRCMERAKLGMRSTIRL